MKRILAVLLMVCGFTITSAEAHGQTNPWLPFGAGVLLGHFISRPQPVYVYQAQPVYGPNTAPTTVYVYPPSAPVIPSIGQVCELRSENINGQIVTGNYCYYR